MLGTQSGALYSSSSSESERSCRSYESAKITERSGTRENTLLTVGERREAVRTHHPLENHRSSRGHSFPPLLVLLLLLIPIPRVSLTTLARQSEGVERPLPPPRSLVGLAAVSLWSGLLILRDGRGLDAPRARGGHARRLLRRVPLHQHGPRGERGVLLRRRRGERLGCLLRSEMEGDTATFAHPERRAR